MTKDKNDIQWRVSPSATTWFKKQLSAESAEKDKCMSPRLVKKEPVTPVNTHAKSRTEESQDAGFLVSLVYLLWFMVPLSARIWAMKNDPDLQDKDHARKQ